MLRPNKLRYYVALMEARGIPPESVLAGTGLEYRRLSDPAYLVDIHQCVAVVANLIRLTGDQGIGLDIGNHARLTDLGITAHAMISSSTLRQAAAYWIEYSNLMGMLVRLELEEAGAEWVVRYSAVEPLGFIYNFCVEEILVSGLKIGEALTGQPLVAKEITLSYPAPLHAALYGRYFDCPVHFNAARSSITIRTPSLETPLPSNDDELNNVIRQHCSQVARQLETGTPVVARIRQLLLRNARRMPSLEEASASFAMSARTLARRLDEEGTSYQALINQLRLDLTVEYLKSEHLTPEEIGDLLGYSDTNAFRRAFKSWSGTTIQRYLERNSSAA
jgi:AraC-like DNA-binding protein